jgi:hypothetical protein
VEPEPESNGHDIVSMAAVLLQARFSRAFGHEEAAAVVAIIIASAGGSVDYPVPYVRKVITTGDPTKFMPAAAPEAAAAKKAKPKHGPHCGECDPHTRLMERPDGRMERCQNCHALRRQLLPQHARCDGCHAVIFRWDLGMPCTGKGHHRVVEEWQAAYDAANEAARVTREAEAAAKADARARGEHVPEPDHGPDWDDTFGLHGEELARAQLEIARAARLPERVNAAGELEAPGPHGENPEVDPDIDPATGQPWPF